MVIGFLPSAGTVRTGSFGVCPDCNAPLVQTFVANPVWNKDGPGPCTGDGDVQMRWVTHCPKCQPHPRGEITMSSTAEKIRRALS
jgi:hypothetical protein